MNSTRLTLCSWPATGKPLAPEEPRMTGPTPIYFLSRSINHRDRLRVWKADAELAG
jgi:hypothetical protein